MKIFDTPGFRDADIDNLEKNKFLIASIMSDDIHAYVLLLFNRVDQGAQGNISYNKQLYGGAATV